MKIDKDMLLMLKSSGLGDGEPDLGAKLMSSFLKVILESGSIPAKIICMGTGIFLTTEGSLVMDSLDKFANGGSEILSCGTCLEYYKRTDRLVVGAPTNMRNTVQSLLNFGRILQP